MAERALRPLRPAGLDIADLVLGAAGRATGVCLDSRGVQPGDIYVALPGRHAHGADFAAQAIGRGAVAILTDQAGAATLAGVTVPVAVVADPRAAMGGVAAEVYGHPAKRLAMFGVTGTNGKTSTVFLLEAALRALGRRVATIGTLGTRLADDVLGTPHGTITTPDSPDLQGILGHVSEAGADAVAMEVSSVGIDQRRVEGITFDVAAFTMLGQDHLDYHGTLERYFEAKSKLFLGGRARVAVVNVDDEGGRRLAALVAADGHARLLTTSAAGSAADYAVLGVEPGPHGTTAVTIATPHGEIGYTLSLLGAFNVANSLTALAMVGAAGLDVARAAGGIASAYIPRRMQRVPLPAGAPNVVIDFAHTPEAVEAALTAIPHDGRTVVVLGAGGDREVQKRPRMGSIAARHADVVVVTDDNPRSEAPADIRAAVLAGAREAGGSAAIVDGGDRRAAIAFALEAAGPGDWVAILGKGHEKTQEIAGVFHPFDDVAVVQELAGREA